MEFFDVISTRRSVRGYKDAPVEEEKIVKCLETARLAPSWKNGQCWNLIVVRDKEKIKAMAHPIVNPWLPQAPCVIVACADPKKSGERDGRQYYLVDTGIAMEHLVLAAAAQGLGTCWIGIYDEAKIKEMLQIPEEMRVVALTPLGYPDEENNLRVRITKGLIEKFSPRRKLEETAFFEKFGKTK
ncbi:MAG: nitroreductase family protein [Candidatus Thermoplasmatota archaeon]|nr:nitroreductase family protein [Candidatus Thermoplasmatota archaeon]